MNIIATTIIAASLLSAPFSIYAGELSIDDAYHNEGFTSYDTLVSNSPGISFDVSLDDMYRNEGSTSYDTPVANSPGKRFDVSLGDMYRNEGFAAYNQDIIDQHSIEGSVLSVAAVAAVK